MAVSEAAPVATTFALASGTVAAEVTGPEGAPLVVGMPGLSANLRSFDRVFAALPGHRRLAFDPRGRGRSEQTPAGTYGWPSHVADILEMADRLGASTFDLVGWSMGGWVAMELCRLAPGRVRRLVLIDGGGIPDQQAMPVVYAGLERLNVVWPSRERFFELVSPLPHYAPWNDFWQGYFEYELEDVAGGVRTRTQRPGPWEDEMYRLSRDPYEVWPAVTMPSLLVRAQREILPGMKYIFNAADRDRFLERVPDSRCVEVDANHYTIAADVDAIAAIRSFLEED